MFPSRDPLNRRSALHSSSLFFTAWMERFDKNSVFLLITVISSSFHTSVIEAALGLYSPHRHSLKFVLPCGGIIWIRQVSGPTFFGFSVEIKASQMLYWTWWLDFLTHQADAQSVGVIISTVCLPAVFWFLSVNMNTDQRHLLVCGGISSNTERTS